MMVGEDGLAETELLLSLAKEGEVVVESKPAEDGVSGGGEGLQGDV